MRSPTRTETDPTRRAILAATDRLINGTPTRSTGRLSVSQLAAEAGIQRWHLTHQHTDLKDQFQARVKELEAGRISQAGAADELAALQEAHADLRRHCAAIETQLRVYATVINLLTMENAALTNHEADTARLLPFPRRIEPTAPSPTSA